MLSTSTSCGAQCSMIFLQCLQRPSCESARPLRNFITLTQCHVTSHLTRNRQHQERALHVTKNVPPMSLLGLPSLTLQHSRLTPVLCDCPSQQTLPRCSHAFHVASVSQKLVHSIPAIRQNPHQKKLFTCSSWRSVGQQANTKHLISQTTARTVKSIGPSPDVQSITHSPPPCSLRHVFYRNDQQKIARWENDVRIKT